MHIVGAVLISLFRIQRGSFSLLFVSDMGVWTRGVLDA